MMIAMAGGLHVLWGAIHLVLIVTLGVLSIRKGHWVMFLIGFIFPLFRLIGVVLPPRRRM